MKSIDMFWVGKLKWDILSVILASLKKGRMMIEKSSHTGNILKDTSFLISRSFWTSKLSGSKKSSSEQYPRGNTLLKIKSHSPLPFNQTLNVFIWVIYHLDRFETEANEKPNITVVLTLFFRVLNDNEVGEIERDAIGFGDDLPPEGLIM